MVWFVTNCTEILAV